MNSEYIQKWYTRVIGILFLSVAISLVMDFYKFGYRLETWHKLFHISVGIIVVYYGWNNKKFWKTFCLANGAFFSLVAAFGIVFPDFANLDAFNMIDTILHGMVGVTGIVIGILKTAKH